MVEYFNDADKRVCESIKRSGKIKFYYNLFYDYNNNVNMGIWRIIYNLLGYEYLGEKEQLEIERQRHLKYLMCKQILESNIKLRCINKKKKKKKNKQTCKEPQETSLFFF